MKLPYLHECNERLDNPPNPLLHLKKFCKRNHQVRKALQKSQLLYALGKKLFYVPGKIAGVQEACSCLQQRETATEGKTEQQCKAAQQHAVQLQW